MNCACIVINVRPFEGEDTLNVRSWATHCLAARGCGLYLSGQREEEGSEVGEAEELGEGEERLHGCRLRV